MHGYSIDPNTKLSGVVHWYDGEASDYDVITAKGRMEMQRKVHASIREAIHAAQCDLTWFASEGVYIGKNNHTGLVMAKLVGAIEYMSDFEQVEIIKVLEVGKINAALGLPVAMRRASREEALRRYMQARAPGLVPDTTIKGYTDVACAYAVGAAALAYGELYERLMQAREGK